MKLRYIGALLLAVLALIAAFAFGLAPRLGRQKALLAASNQERDRVPIVDTVVVRRSSKTADLVLPGNIDAMFEAPIYARADGYLKKLYVDIGDRVHAGQVLGDIESPELDQQLRQARSSVNQAKAALKQAEAAVAQARANLALAKVTLDRWKQLVAAGVAARQDGDEKQAAYDARQADLEAAEASVAAALSNIGANDANVQRLVEMKAFDSITAPFDGIITVRNTTSGTLISAGTNSPNRELLREAQIDLLRIFISVPQTNAAAIHVNMPADVTVQELPARVFHGIVARTANSLDEASRTMRTEVHVRNPDHALLPGMYGQVKFQTARSNAPPLIPGDTLVIRSGGTQVAVIGPDRKVHFQKIVVGRDYGPEVEVTSGLSEGDTVIVNPGDEIREGVVVQPRK
ncbi:MAG TPA: efflux RND transporter periplasmic adaptor subunit [Bryobacteraceae bacterium]